MVFLCGGQRREWGQAMRLLTILLATTVIGAPSGALAQTAPQPSDVIIMRRVLAPPNPQAVATPTPTPSGTPTPTPTPTQAPGPAQWNEGDWTFTGTETCTSSAPQTRTVTCEGATGVVPDSNCTATKPPSSRSVERTEGCTYSWQDGTYSAYSSACSDAATRTQLTPTTCVRSDGTAVPDTQCDQNTKPNPELIKGQYQGCTNSWILTDPGTWSSTCSTTATRQITYQCRRSGVNVTTTFVPDAECPTANPSYTEGPATTTSGCVPSFTDYDTCIATTPGGTTGTQTAILTTCTAPDGASVPLAL